MNPPIVYELTKPTAQRTSKMTAMVQSIFVTSCRGIATFFHCMEPMLILSGGIGHRPLSDMRIAVCLILGPVFVLWIKATFTEGTASRDSCADHSFSVGGSVSICGVVTSTTLEGDESPEVFHA